MSKFDPKDLPVNLLATVTYHNLADDEILFNRNEVADAVFIVDHGRIKLIHYLDDGTTVNHYVIKPGEYFAEVALFNETYVCSAIAKSSTRVMALPKQLFLDALNSDINLSRNFTEQLVRRLHQTKLLLELRGIRSARDRVLHYLQVMTPPNQKILDLEQPLKDIASDIGITPESLSRVLSQLQNEGILTRLKRKIIFRD
ncbi:MAG: Crp/Fnr family transcriptional regulator [Nostocales cyanobacterium 94392]|nr:Crp/Fnr family transcriptional regulator [Nostocales cyanobacterium 94392]